MNLFNDKFNNIEIPYLVSEFGDDEQYSYTGIALEVLQSGLDTITFKKTENNVSVAEQYPNITAWFNEMVEHYVDDYGYFDYDLILHARAEKFNMSDSTSEVLYEYPSVSLIYDVNKVGYISPINSYHNVKLPDEDISLLISPNGDIVGKVDNSPNYNIDENNNFVDLDGNIVYKPHIDDDVIYLTDNDGNIVGDIRPFGDTLPTSEDKTNGTIKNKSYDISFLIRNLKKDLQDIFGKEGKFKQFCTMFQQVINWLPFSIKTLFALLISFFIIFEFIRILRN